MKYGIFILQWKQASVDNIWFDVITLKAMWIYWHIHGVLIYIKENKDWIVFILIFKKILFISPSSFLSTFYVIKKSILIFGIMVI